jgi:hypothetical protein
MYVFKALRYLVVYLFHAFGQAHRELAHVLHEKLHTDGGGDLVKLSERMEGSEA